jgi:dTMP kinase
LEAEKSGKLIVFEGLDGSGTTSQSALLSERLDNRGFSVIQVEEPGGTELGRKVRNLLLEDQGLDINPLSELFLFEVSRAQLVRKKILPALEEGKMVISDRFAISSVAYQGHGRGVPIDQVKKINEMSVEDLEPDVTFFLDINLEERLKRTGDRKPDRIEKEEKEFYRRVREGYLEEIKSTSNAVVIDGSLSKGEISSKVNSVVDKII